MSWEWSLKIEGKKFEDISAMDLKLIAQEIEWGNEYGEVLDNDGN